jgi:hypothetical protein
LEPSNDTGHFAILARMIFVRTPAKPRRLASANVLFDNFDRSLGGRYKAG